MKLVQLEQIDKSHRNTIDNIPEGWTKCPLKTIATRITKGATPTSYGFKYQEKGIRFVKVENLQNGRIDHDSIKHFISEQANLNQSRSILLAGDVLFSIAGTIGTTCIVREEDLPANTNQALAIIRGTSDVLFPAFLQLQLKSAIGSRQVTNQARGGSMNNISLGDVDNIQVCVSPLAEQKRMVAKVEQLLARVNSARERLAKVPEILKRFRQSVLAAACSGRLTADWRDNNPNLESAERLIERIFAKREEQRKVEFKTVNGGGAKKPKKQAGFRPRKVEAKELPAIPEQWAWVYLPDLGYMSRGKSRHRPRNAPHLYGGPYPFIQTGDIAQSGGRITSHRQTYSEDGLAQSCSWPAGTVCITIAANIASSAILTYPSCFPDSVVGVNPNVNLSLAEYLEFFIRIAQADLDQFAPATAQKNINIGILNDVVVPLPPFAEQQEIVRRVEAMFKLADGIEKRVTAAMGRAEKLTQAILTKAFRGELVPTEAELARREGRSYEPASALLAKIEAQRKDVKPERKCGRLRRRKRNK